MFSVFISSTHEDLEQERSVVKEHICAIGLKCIDMESWPPASSPPIDAVKSALCESDLYVGIFAWKYGSRVSGDDTYGDVSYTEYEYMFAKDINLPRLIFILDPELNWAPKHMDRGLDGIEIERLRNEIAADTTILWKPFRTPMDLVNNLSGALFKNLVTSNKFHEMGEEQRAIIRIRQLVNSDFIARQALMISSASLTSHNWFISELSRCNVGERYILRGTVRKDIADWLLRNQCPYLFVTGPAGIGKTNFLLMEVVRYILADIIIGQRPFLSQQAVIFLAAGSYMPDKSFWDNLTEYMRRTKVSKDVLSSLIHQGKAVVILDGLDEFVRNHGEKKTQQLLSALEEQIDHASSKVVISCRDHIHNLLEKKGLLLDKTSSESLKVPALMPEEVKIALGKRLGKKSLGYIAVANNDTLIRFAQKPLILEMMCRISREGWKRLVDTQTLGRLYNIWFEEIIAAGADTIDVLHDEFLESTNLKVGKIAGLMLKKRSDLILETELDEAELPIHTLTTLTRQPFGLFIKQTPTEWGFVHDSFREFSLAKTIATEYFSKDYSLLAHTSSFDYVGAETFQFLRDILPVSTKFFEHVKRALDYNTFDHSGWNNIIRNSFEAIGMIGEKSEEQFLKEAVSFLALKSSHSIDNNPPLATVKTKYNLCRALERMHGSSPRPYYQHVLSKAWAPRPSWNCFGATAIRGFHAQEPYPGSMPPMVYNLIRNDGKYFMQKEVSQALVGLLLECQRNGRDQETEFLEINASYALIRWLHEDNIGTVKGALAERHLLPCSRGNLFQAFLRFNKPEILLNCSKLFRGMEISWIYLSHDMVPDDFSLIEVIFDRHDQSIIRGLPPSLFENCVYR